MSVLQTALLILGVVAVIAIYFLSRRDKNSLKAWAPPSAVGLIKPPSSDQMEMFSSRGGEFDEFGVGRPRKRTEPTMPGVPTQTLIEEEPAIVEEAVRVPAFVAQPKAAEKIVEQKIVAILIAEREGTAILGKKLHTALKQQTLVYGDRKIYHRLEMDQTLFSVAGLLKPGQLDPSEADTFSTPGLTLFMVLPGPAKPTYALRNLLSTAKNLAKSLNAELFDAKRQPFTAEAESTMIAEVEDWAQRNA